MAARAHSADPRAERIRAQIRDAAFTLAHERQVNGLTVSDIADRAGVSRQAFYQHFNDRDDAVAGAFSAAFAEVTAGYGQDPQARIVNLFAFADQHRAMYRNIVPSAVTDRVVSAFRAELAPACREIAHRGIPAVPPIAGLSPESVGRFLVGGYVEVLRSWMEDPESGDLAARVQAALETVGALLGFATRSVTMPLPG